MTHREKVDRLVADLGKQGVSAYTVAPPMWRTLWALGIQVPPPFFLGFFTLTFLTGTAFAAFWGVCMALFDRLMWRTPGNPLLLAAVSAVLGLLFGLTTAGFCRWKAKRLGLPPWESYGSDDAR